MRRKKTLLIIAAGIEQIPAIRLARKMGLYVVVIDGNPDAPGFRYADDYGVVSTYDIEGTVDFALDFNKRRKIDGVMTIAADVPLTVSTVAERLNLPGNPVKVANLVSDKLRMKRRFKCDRIPIPWFREIKGLSELNSVVRNRRFSIVVKPVDSRGARGVLRLEKDIDLDWAYRTSLSHSPAKRVMVEEFLEGLQVSTESIVYDGKIFTPGFSDRNYEFLDRFRPYIIENGGELPSVLNSSQRVEIENLIAKAARSLGIKRGVVKGDIVYTKDGPKVIEIAARLSGGWFCTDEIPLSTGVYIIKAVIQISLGVKPDFNALLPRYHKGVALRFLFPEEGRVKRISGLDKARRIKGVKRIGIYVRVGDFVEKITDHTKRAGYVISQARTREEAVEVAKRAVKTIRIITEA